MLQIIEKIIISKDFTDAPGARYKTDGDKSGEEFYDKHLKVKFQTVLSQKGLLHIDLDDTWGYASSFISASFGRLSKEFKAEVVLKHLDFKSDDDPLLIEKIKHLITNPERSE